MTSVKTIVTPKPLSSYMNEIPSFDIPELSVNVPLLELPGLSIDVDQPLPDEAGASGMLQVW